MNLIEIKTKSVLTGPDSGLWRATLSGFGATLKLSGEDSGTTLDRLSLSAAVVGLSALRRRSAVEMYTDSEYVSHGCAAWFPKWALFTNGKAPLRNLSLWQELYEVAARHDIHWYGPRSKRTSDILPEFKTELVGHSTGTGSAHLYSGATAPWDPSLGDFRPFTADEMNGVCSVLTDASSALDTDEVSDVVAPPESNSRSVVPTRTKRLALLPLSNNRLSTIATRVIPDSTLSIEIII